MRCRTPSNLMQCHFQMVPAGCTLYYFDLPAPCMARHPADSYSKNARLLAWFGGRPRGGVGGRSSLIACAT